MTGRERVLCMLKGGRPDRLPLMPITTRLYETFVWSYEKKLVDGIHAAGGRVRLHICGNTRRILAGIGKLGCELVDLDYPVVLRQARAIMGPAQVLAGNIEPVGELRNGTPDRSHRTYRMPTSLRRVNRC
jgi:uroporphyrinogen-III decarboxylase